MRRSTPTPRRIALAVGVVASVAAGWWLLRAPAIEHRAVVTPPEIDIDPPAMRARREAALALAVMPDDPWTFAESLAASAPAAPAPKENCGIDGRPKFAPATDPAQAPVQMAGASSRYAAAQARVDAALRASADPLDRAVADLLNVGAMRSEIGRDEAVAQQAVATTDARLYALAWRLCGAGLPAAPSCQSISLDRWAELDADNGIPWIAMLARARAQGDAAQVRASLARVASATRFDTYWDSAPAAVAALARPDDPDLAAIDDLARQAGAVRQPFPAIASGPLMAMCHDRAGGDALLAQTCRSISDAMFAHSDNLNSEFLSGLLFEQATGDASRHDVVQAERAFAASHWSPGTGFSECGALRDSLSAIVHAAKVGQVEAMRERARRFVPP